MSEVFISYKQEERETMLPIAQKLRSLGVSVWFDAELQPGRSFSQEIMHHIEACKAQIVCWSPAAIASEWVRGEADIGRQRGVLIAVLIEPCRLMPPFNMLHAENLVGWRGDQNHSGWQKVLLAVSHHLGRNLSAPKATAADPEQLVAQGDVFHRGKNSEKARDLYERAAAAGSARGQYRLAYMLEWETEPPNDERAKQLYKVAAAAGHSGAMERYALMLRGEGNDAQARSLYAAAAVKGHTGAMGQFAAMSTRGEGGAVEHNLARDWLLKAAHGGDPLAMEHLALMLEKGEGGPKDLQGAQRWRGLAQQLGAGVAYDEFGRVVSTQNKADFETAVHFVSG